MSDSSTSLVEEDDIEEEEGDVVDVYSQITPYEDEPLAADDREDMKELMTEKRPMLMVSHQQFWRPDMKRKLQ